MVSRYSNELNSFRNGIEDRVSQHKDKMQAVNQALGIKADKVFENAKKIGDISSKLMESGIGGGVGATALGKYARKGISKFNQFKQDATDKLDEVGNRAKGLADQAESKLQEAGSNVEGKVGELKDAAGNMEGQVRQTAQNAQSGAEDAAQSARDSVPSESTNGGGANQSVGSSTQEAGGPQYKIAPDEEGGNSQVNLRWETTERRVGGEYDGTSTTATNVEGGETGADSQGMAIRGRVLDEDPAENTTTYDELMKPDVVKYTGDATEQKEGDGEAFEDAVPKSGGSGGDVELSNIGETTTDATPELESGLISGATDLEEDAAATSWLGFLGIPEILAGLGAVAGIAAAGVGIADAVKSGDQTAKAQAMPTQAPKAGFQAAGTFIVPTMDSIS